MKILVTGGSGYLGSHIASDLVERGHDIMLLNRREHPEFGRWNERFKTVISNVAKAEETIGACRGIDVVVHTAALNAAQSEADTKAAILVNGYGTANMLEAAAEAGVGLFIYLSTFHVYGPSASSAITENDLPNPIGNYALTHMLGEMFCRQYARKKGLPVAVLRLSNGYGAPLFRSADCWMLALNDFAKRAVEEGVIQLNTTGAQKRDFIAISDIAQAINVVLDNPARAAEVGLFNVGSGIGLSVRDLAALTAAVYKEQFGQQVTVRFNEGAVDEGPALDFTYDIGRIRKLGFTPGAEMRAEIKKLLLFLKNEA